TFDAYVRRVCADSGADASTTTYASSTSMNPPPRAAGARPLRAGRSAIPFSEAESARCGPRFCAFSEATLGVYFRERYFSEVAPPGIWDRLRTPGAPTAPDPKGERSSLACGEFHDRGLVPVETSSAASAVLRTIAPTKPFRVQPEHGRSAVGIAE